MYIIHNRQAKIEPIKGGGLVFNFCLLKFLIKILKIVLTTKIAKTFFFLNNIKIACFICA
jgi:hypothetical protein